VRRHLNGSDAGSLAPTPHPDRKQRLESARGEVLRQQVEAHHNWSLAEHAEAISAATGVTLKKSSVGNYLKRLGISYKKNFRASEQDEQQRAHPRGEVATQATTRLLFIDETSAYVGQSREYGWAASAERVYDTRPKGKKERVSLVAVNCCIYLPIHPT